MKKNLDVALLGSHCLKINDKAPQLEKIRVECNYHKLKKKIHYFNPLIHPSVIFRKKL